MKGRATSFNPTNRFLREQREVDEWCASPDDEPVRTRFIDTFPKTIVNHVPNKDVPMDWSANPYQGC